MQKILIILLIVLIPCDALAKKNEKYYQTLHCQELEGEIEHRLQDRTRIDCLTKNEAIEHDWAKKWAECIGQALYYGAVKDKTPVCVLIGSKAEFDKFSLKIKLTAEHYNLPIKIIHIEKEE